MSDFSEATEYIVNRIEVIDWTASAKTGRAFTKWVEGDFEVGFDVQDGGRTLKVFLTDPPVKPQVKESK